MKHEAKKAYFIALKEAFLIWNPVKLKELEDNMEAGGMTKKEIEAQMYFNPGPYNGCVDRYAPSPKILYWRVRAVYALCGNIIDSKTKKPLFNAEAWKKADNVLKEILCGFYSDPPGVEMYTKRLRPNKTVMKNMYGMDMIECFRGTNRTEGYHKNLVTTFGSWQTGVEMSDCLLAERRHRHNQNVSEKRRPGFPKTGHYDSWKIDQQQNLYLENHGTQLYPDWSNASDYKDTNESFDTVPLHSVMLHDALEKRYKILGKIKLTKDHRYMCDAMDDLRFPFLPFSHKDEYKQFAKYSLDIEGKVDADKASIDWCEFVDGVTIHAKLPSQIRTYLSRFDRNQRIKECVSKAKSGLEMLSTLNSTIVPTAELSESVENNAICPVIQTAEVANEIPPPANSTAAQPKSTGLSYVWPAPKMASNISVPNAQAMHNRLNIQVGGMVVGARPVLFVPVRILQCTRCRLYEGRTARICPGKGGTVHCHYFLADGKQIIRKRKRLIRCGVCRKEGCRGIGGWEHCLHGDGKQKPKKKK